MDTPAPKAGSTPFEKEARKKRRGLLRELWAFLMENKKWWLIPIILMLLLLVVIAIFAATGAAPFIYTLF
jgi:hypothetical protein